MANRWNARLVSGEIMTAPAASVEQRSCCEVDSDIVDAQFEVIEPAEGARGHASSGGRETTAPPQGMDVLRRSGPKAGRPGHGGPFFLLGVAMLATAVFWISGGHVLLSAETVFAAFPR